MFTDSCLRCLLLQLKLSSSEESHLVFLWPCTCDPSKALGLNSPKMSEVALSWKAQQWFAAHSQVLAVTAADLSWLPLPLYWHGAGWPVVKFDHSDDLMVTVICDISSIHNKLKRVNFFNLGMVSDFSLSVFLKGKNLSDRKSCKLAETDSVLLFQTEYGLRHWFDFL